MFFPKLVRQKDYPKNVHNEYYGYAHYREHIELDCQGRCVYCDALQNEVGGKETMQIDHFRPESFPEFEHLINDPLNLHYACARCNLWKSNNWPARGTPHTHDGINGFLDPFQEDRRNYFRIHPDGRIEGLNPPAPYIIKILHLEREFLRKLRERRLLLAEFRSFKSRLLYELQADLDAGRKSDPAIIVEFIKMWDSIDALLQ